MRKLDAQLCERHVKDAIILLRAAKKLAPDESDLQFEILSALIHIEEPFDWETGEYGGPIA